MDLTLIYSLVIGLCVTGVILMLIHPSPAVRRKSTALFAVTLAVIVATYLTENPMDLEYFRARIAYESLFLVLAVIGGLAYLIRKRTGGDDRGRGSQHRRTGGDDRGRGSQRSR